MTRPESITAGPFLDTAAVLRGWSDAKFDALRPDLTFDSERIFKAGDELAEALRAANPPINSESSTETATPAALDPSWHTDPVLNQRDVPPFPPDVMVSALQDVVHKTSGVSRPGRSFKVPATPAVGEEAGADCECTCAAELVEKVRALLADVARLQKELDGTTFREERYAEDAVGARLALEDARAEVARLTEERDNTTKALRRADSMLTAVRKIADDYHDVDVTGDPPREVACNPCANDILNVLEGRKP